MRVRTGLAFGLSAIGLVAGGIFAVKTVEKYRKTEKEPLKVVKDAAITVACLAASGVAMASEAQRLYSENVAYSDTYYHNKAKLNRLQVNGKDVFGNKKWSGFMDEFYADYIYSDLISNHVPELTGFGRYLCYDTFRKRYFRSNIEQLRRTEERIAEKLRSGKKFVSVNDWLKVNKLSTMPEYEFVGWKKPEEVIFNHSIHMAGGEPCCIVCYEPSPKYVSERRNAYE